MECLLATPHLRVGHIDPQIRESRVVSRAIVASASPQRIFSTA
jgi:hypothetical protein